MTKLFWPTLLLCFWLAGCADDDRPPTASPRMVEVATVARADHSVPVTLSGHLRAARRSRLSFEVGGKVTRVTVDVGDDIRAGQTLARLADKPYRLQVARARAALAEARAAAREAQLDLERQRELKKRGFISQSRLDSAEAANDSARSRLESARASLDLAERDLSLTLLKAPFAGSVSERLAEPSERVGPNEPVLAVISAEGGFEVVTHLPEALISRVTKGQSLEVAIAALGGELLPARVEHVGSRPVLSNNYPLIVGLERNPPALRAGMTAQVNLNLAEPPAPDKGEGHWTVPLTSLLYGEDKVIRLLRLQASNRLEAVPVTVVHLGDRRAVVAGPLAAGDRVVSRGVEFVAPGEPVRVLSEGPERYN